MSECFILRVNVPYWPLFLSGNGALFAATVVASWKIYFITDPTIPQVVSIRIDLLHLQGLALICASTCCKAVFRSSFGPCRRSQGLGDRRYVLESAGNKLNFVGLVQMKTEHSLCDRWMRVWAAIPVNAKGLMRDNFFKVLQIQWQVRCYAAIQEQESALAADFFYLDVLQRFLISPSKNQNAVSLVLLRTKWRHQQLNQKTFNWRAVTITRPYARTIPCSLNQWRNGRGIIWTSTWTPNGSVLFAVRSLRRGTTTRFTFRSRSTNLSVHHHGSANWRTRRATSALMSWVRVIVRKAVVLDMDRNINWCDIFTKSIQATELRVLHRICLSIIALQSCFHLTLLTYDLLCLPLIDIRYFCKHSKRSNNTPECSLHFTPDQIDWWWSMLSRHRFKFFLFVSRQ